MLMGAALPLTAEDIGALRPDTDPSAVAAALLLLRSLKPANGESPAERIANLLMQLRDSGNGCGK
jgi:hypothetical protein